jgi:hypothetical protein
MNIIPTSSWFNWQRRLKSEKITVQWSQLDDTRLYIVLININIKIPHYVENIGGTITSIIDLGSVVQRFKSSYVRRSIGGGKIISSGKKIWNLWHDIDILIKYKVHHLMIIVIVSADEISLKSETAFIKRESSRTTCHGGKF